MTDFEGTGSGRDSSKSDEAVYRLSDAIGELLEPSVILQACESSANIDVVSDGNLNSFSKADERVVRECEHTLFTTKEPFSERCILEYRKVLFGHGCPAGIRGVLWKALLDYLPTTNFSLAGSNGSREAFYAEVDRVLEEPRTRYNEMAAAYNIRCRSLEQWEADDKRLYNDIRVDLPRTFMPGFTDFCASKTLQTMLGRIIYIWSIRTPGISYFQGLIDLADMFVFCFLAEDPTINGDFNRLAMTNFDFFSKEFLDKVEADTFWCMTRLLNIMERCFTANFLEGVDMMLEQIGNILGVSNPPLWSSLVMKDVQLSFFAFRWIICLLVREFTVPNAMLIWDSYMALSDCFPRYHLFVCAQLIIFNEEQIKRLDMYNIVNHMQSMPCETWTSAQLRRLLDESIILSEKYPFPDDTSSRNHSAMPARIEQIKRQQNRKNRREALMNIPNKVLTTVENSKMTETLAIAIRNVLKHFSSTGSPISVKEAKRIVAYIVILAAVCLTATGTVIAIRKMHSDQI